MAWTLAAASMPTTAGARRSSNASTWRRARGLPVRRAGGNLRKSECIIKNLRRMVASHPASPDSKSRRQDRRTARRKRKPYETGDRLAEGARGVEEGITGGVVRWVGEVNRKENRCRFFGCMESFCLDRRGKTPRRIAVHAFTVTL